jgi:TnpA family transposase
VLQQRLLLCLFGIGTNVGLKRVASQQPGITFDELRYVKRRFVNKEALRAAVAEIVNGTFAHPSSRDLGRGHHLVRLRLQAVRCLRPEPDDGMARALRRGAAS